MVLLFPQLGQNLSISDNWKPQLLQKFVFTEDGGETTFWVEFWSVWGGWLNCEDRLDWFFST